MLCEVYSLTALPSQTCQIVGSLGATDKTIQQSDASTILYLCVRLLVSIGIKT